MSLPIQMHIAIMTEPIGDAEIVDPEAVMPTTLIRVHLGEINRLARMHRPLDILPADRHADFATQVAMRPTIVFAPIVNDFL